jgi:hypothetical protein
MAAAFGRPTAATRDLVAPDPDQATIGRSMPGGEQRSNKMHPDNAKKNRQPMSKKKLLVPWIAGKKLFGAEATDAPPFWSFGEGLQILSIARALVGIVVAGSIYAHFRVDYANTAGSSEYLALNISMGITALFTAIEVLWNHDFSREALRPGIRAIVGLLVMAAIIPIDHWHNQLSIAGFVASIAAIWYIFFWTTCLIYWLRYPFGTSKAYPSLGPNVTGATVIVVMLVSLIRWQPGGVPILIWLGVTFAGTLTSLALVALELHLVRRNSMRAINPNT